MKRKTREENELEAAELSLSHAEFDRAKLERELLDPEFLRSGCANACVLMKERHAELTAKINRLKTKLNRSDVK